MKRISFVTNAIIMLFLLASLHSCIPLVLIMSVVGIEEEIPEQCVVVFENNSDKGVAVEGMFFLSPDRTNKSLESPKIAFQDFVGRKSLANLSLPILDEDKVTWATYFSTYEADSFVVAIASSLDSLSQWRTLKNDSLLLRKYKITPSNMHLLDNMSYISYP